MLSMLSWIPLLGPILQGVGTIFSKFMDTKATMYATERTADVEEAKVSAQIIHDTNDDIALRMMRDAACLPVVVWTMLIGWDTLIAKTSWKVWMWHVADYPPAVGYIPYVVMVFLFGNIGLNVWKRR